MPDEPSAPHPLEDALRAQAARRRADLDAGRPPELPGPVRAALLRELERGAAPTRDQRAPHSAPWWWRWQTLLVTTACVLLAVGIFRREADSPPAATDKISPPTASAPSVAADRRKSTGPTEAMRERTVVPSPEPATSRDADLAAAPPPAPVIPPAGQAGGTFADRPAPPADEERAQPPPATRLEPPSPPGRSIASAPAASTDALLGGAAKPAPAATVASQRFLQTPLQQTLRSARAVGSSPVLTDFTLRRDGDTLVIRDGDGSEYRAPLDAAKRESNRTDAFKKDASRRGIAANDRSAADGEPVAFRATGVNQTLKQTVVIEGILRPALAEESPAAAAPLARSKAAAAPAPAKPKEALSRAAAPSRASIRGRAIISGQEYAVEAEEAGPPPATR